MRAAYGMPTRHARKDLRQLQHVAHALGADALEHEAATSLLSGTEAMSTVQAFAHAAAEGDLEGARAHLLAMCKDGTATLASWDVLDLEPEVRLCMPPPPADALPPEPAVGRSPQPALRVPVSAPEPLGAGCPPPQPRSRPRIVLLSRHASRLRWLSSCAPRP